MNWLILRNGKFVAAIIDFRDQILHLKAVERGQTDKHLIEHDTQSPCVYFLAVTALF